MWRLHDIPPGVSKRIARHSRIAGIGRRDWRIVRQPAYRGMMANPRIVSLLPSATEIACALGFGEALVGRSHECDFPPDVAALPVLTDTRIGKGLGSRAIEDRVRAIVAQGLSCYAVDAERLRALAPDVLLTQTQCAVCAVTPGDLGEALAAWTGAPPTLVSTAPDDLSDVWADFAGIAAALGAPDRAPPVVAALTARLDALADATRALPRPRVLAVEWIDPPMAAGNWVPELIVAAGGEPLLAGVGEHSPYVAWTDIADADPDAIVLMRCGFELPRTLAELATLRSRPEWTSLRAVREGRVFAADGHHYFNRPGPRLVESAEILAECLHGLDFGLGHAWTIVA